jgi:hypothetical protein
VSIIHNDTDFAPSLLPEHYTPPRESTLAERFMRAVIGLACFACLGVLLAACGGGENEDERASIQPPQCAAQPEMCK